MQSFDCFDRDGRYLGVYYAESIEQLSAENKRVSYVAGIKAKQSGKHWSAYTIDDLDSVTELVRINDETDEMEKCYEEAFTKIQRPYTSRRSSEDSLFKSAVNDNIVIEEPVTISSELRRFLEEELKAKEKEKSILLIEVGRLREEIKKIRKQLGYS